MESIIYALYERQDQMKSTLSQLDKEIARNEGIIEVLNRASEEEQKKLDIVSFTKTVQEQIDAYKSQRAKFQAMIDNTNKALSLYESDKDKYKEMLETILYSFGFVLDEPKA